jgi:pyruvate dehydrogenase E2 component (dihydrolipoamide acetyltransferase)
MQERIVERGGYRIRIRSRGPADGPHAIVLPGMGATAVAVAPQIRALRTLGYTVHVIELPGFGLEPALRKEDARMTQLAGLVLGAAEAIGVRRAVLLGHSLGGGIALHLALRQPAFVAGLVLLAPAALGRSLHWSYKLFCIPLVGRALMRPYRHGTRSLIRHFLIGRKRRDDAHFVDALLRHDAQSAAKARTMRAIVWANQPSIWRRLLLVFVPGGEQLTFTLRGRLADLAEIPTLVLWGSEDRVISASDARLVRAAHPDAEVHVARGIGHMLPLEAPAWTNQHLAWFDKLRLRPARPNAA